MKFFIQSFRIDRWRVRAHETYVKSDSGGDCVYDDTGDGKMAVPAGGLCRQCWVGIHRAGLKRENGNTFRWCKNALGKNQV